MLIAIILTVLFLLVHIAAVCNKLMDKWMIEYINLPSSQQLLMNSDWKSFNPRAKWYCGDYNSGLRAYNYLFLKIGIRTRFASDNCNDGWHFCKSVMIFCLCSAITLALILGTIVGFLPGIVYAFFVGVLGTVWNFTFNKYKPHTFK